MTKYTITVPHGQEGKFRQCMARLEEDEYIIHEELHDIETPDMKRPDKQTIMEMDAEAALTFRLGMNEVKIRRERTQEELDEEKRIDDMHTVHIHVKVPGLNEDGTIGEPTIISVGKIGEPDTP